MPLIDLKRLNKFYTVRVYCTNCAEIQELRIPKGEGVDTYLDSEKALCSNCGCATLELKKEMKKGVVKKDEKNGPFG